MRTLVLFLFSAVAYAGNCSSSFGNGYSFCRAIDIDHTKVSNTSQTNFPMLVTGTLAYLKTVGNGGKVQSASGFDIIFTSNQAGTNVLKFERAVWSATTGTVEFWIKIPTLSASVDTTIYLFYGKTGVVVDPSDHANTWDANYQGVWHFGDGTTLTLTDSTANANTGTNHSATACAGQILGAACFASSGSQYIDVGNNASLEIQTPITIEAWTKYTASIPVGPTAFPVIATNVTTNGLNGYFLAIHSNDGGGFANNFYLAAINAGAEKDLTGGFTVVQNTVYYVAATYDSAASGTNAVLYISNNAQRSSPFSTNAIGASTESILFSKGPQAGIAPYWDGYLDELRISNIARSADWIATGYANTNSPSTFYSIGAEVQGGSGGGGLRLLIFR